MKQMVSRAAGQETSSKLQRPRPLVLIWGLLAGGAVVGRAWLDRPAWSGWLPLTVSYWSDLATLMSVGAAGLCSWLVLSLLPPRAEGQGDVGACTPLRYPVWPVAIPFVATAAGVTAALLVMVARSVRDGAVPVAATGMTLWCVGTLAAVAAFTALSGLVTWRVRRHALVVVMPLIVYVAWVAPQYTITPPPWNALYAGISEAWTDDIPVPAAMAARAAMWLLAAVGCVALTAGRRSVAGVSAVLALTSLTVGLLNTPDRAPVGGASAVVCAGSRPVVCTRGVWKAGLGQAAAVLDEGYATLPDQLVPEVVGSDPETGIAGLGPEVVFQVSGHNASPTNLPDRSSTLAALGATIFASCPQPGPAQLALLVWWRQALALPLDQPARPGDVVPVTQLAPEDYQRDLAAADRLGNLSHSNRDRWFSDHADQIQECTLKPADLP